MSYLFERFIRNAPKIIKCDGIMLSKFEITENMHDSEAYKKINTARPLTVAETIATLKFFVERQWEGQLGILSTNTHPNTIFTKLDNGKIIMVVVGAVISRRCRENWFLDSWEIGSNDPRNNKGDMIFSCF